MSQWENYFHLVWTTKQRQLLLTPDKEKAVFKCALRLTQEMGYELLAINGTENHVHILLRTGPKVDLSALVKKVKGTTSALLNDMTNHESNFRWQEGYFSATVTPSHVSKIQAYVQNQKEHHYEGTTHAFWERTEEERDSIS